MFDMTLPQAEFWSNVSNVALLCAAVVVVLGTYTSMKTSAVKERFSNERISANERETARAKADAAEANARAAQANLKAETERVERLKLEAKLAPRSLTLAQQANVRDKVRAFAAQPFMFITYQDDKEARTLLLMIGQALLNAGWEGRKPNGFLMVELFEGVDMELTNENAERFRPAAEALAAALNAEQVQARAIVNPKITDPFDYIRIRVGKKP